MLDTSSEIIPFIIYRECDTEESAICATWMLENEHEALALFLTEESAQNYIKTVLQTDEWKVHQPARDHLTNLLVASHASGMKFTVLEPSNESAKRVFPLDQVIENIQQA